MKDKTPEEIRHATAMNLVLKCGVPPCLKGCQNLAQAVDLFSTRQYSMSDTYRKIADDVSIEPKSVIRNIAYAISKSFDLSELLSEMVGVKIPSSQIHNSLVISYLAIELNYLLEPYES